LSGCGGVVGEHGRRGEIRGRAPEPWTTDAVVHTGALDSRPCARRRCKPGGAVVNGVHTAYGYWVLID